MAGIGLKSFKYAKLSEDGKTYGEVKTLAGAIECKVSLDLSEATLYSDDTVKEQVTAFKSGTITAGIDDDNSEVFAELLGQTVDKESGLVTSNANDLPIYVGFGHIVPKIINGVKKYKVEFFGKVKFKPFIADSKTKGDGFESYYHYKGGTSKTLAQNIEQEIIKIGQNSRGCKIKLNAQGTDYFGFIRQTVAPAVIVEGAFLDNQADVKIIDELHEQQAFGVAYAKGILKTLGIEVKQSEVKNDGLFRVQVGAFVNKSNAENLVKKLKDQGYSDAFIK